MTKREAWARLARSSQGNWRDRRTSWLRRYPAVWS